MSRSANPPTESAPRPVAGTVSVEASTEDKPKPRGRPKTKKGVDLVDSKTVQAEAAQPKKKTRRKTAASAGEVLRGKTANEDSPNVEEPQTDTSSSYTSSVPSEDLPLSQTQSLPSARSLRISQKKRRLIQSSMGLLFTVPQTKQNPLLPKPRINWEMARWKGRIFWAKFGRRRKRQSFYGRRERGAIAAPVNLAVWSRLVPYWALGICFSGTGSRFSQCLLSYSLVTLVT